MNAGEITALCLAVGGFVTAVFSGLQAFLASRAKTRQEAAAEEFAESQRMLDRQEKQIERLQRQLDTLQAAVNELWRAITAEQVDNAETYGDLVRMHELAARQAGRLQDLKQPCEPVPDLRPRPPRRDYGFMVRSVSQDSVAAGAITQAIREDVEQPGKKP